MSEPESTPVADERAVPTSMDDLLAVDPGALAEPLPWSLMLEPLSFFHVSKFDIWEGRKRLGIDVHRGIAGTARQRSLAWATVCYVATTVGDIESERFRLRAVQTALREDCCAWHATWLAAGKRGDCYCKACRPEPVS